MAYRLKHIPTQLYYKPCGFRGSNLSEKGKVYQGGVHGLSSAFRRLEKYPQENTFKVYFQRDSRISKKLENQVWHTGSNSTEVYIITKITDWIIEEL